MEHSSPTSVRYLTLFSAMRFTSCHVSCLSISSNSAILLHLQVCWGLALLRFPYGFHSMALLAMYMFGLLSVWPIQPQALCVISCSTGRCSACLQSSSLRIRLGHQIRRMFLGLLLMNTCSFIFNPLVGR